MERKDNRKAVLFPPGSRFIRCFLSKRLSHSAILGSVAARPWDRHLGQVFGVVRVHSDGSVASQLSPLSFITRKAR